MTDERSTPRDRLPDWVAGRLDGPEAREVAEAVDGDPDLAAEARLLGVVLAARPEPPEELAERIARAANAQAAAGPGPAAGARSRSRPSVLFSRWGLAAAAAAVLALGTLELMERSVSSATAEGPLAEVELAAAPDPWGEEEEFMVAGAPVLENLSDEAAAALLEELGG